MCENRLRMFFLCSTYYNYSNLCMLTLYYIIILNKKVHKNNIYISEKQVNTKRTTKKIKKIHFYSHECGCVVCVYVMYINKTYRIKSITFYKGVG